MATNVALAVACAPADAIDIVAGPGGVFRAERPTTHSGEAASTSAGAPLIVTRFASASPLNRSPQIENRSRSESTGATETCTGVFASAPEATTATAEAP